MGRLLGKRDDKIGGAVVVAEDVAKEIRKGKRKGTELTEVERIE